MGCDGGTIPKRHELVKTAKKPIKKDPSLLRQAKWSTCSISQQNLTEPVVACELGKLYSKESVLEFLLDRSICDTAAHIRNLKDVKVLTLTKNTGFNKSVSHLADQYIDSQLSPYICPIVGIEMNGSYKFCFLWSCGCVLSERAIKEVESETCHNCGTKFSKEDIIILYPEGKDLDEMKGNMEERRANLKALKKQMKEKKAGEKRKLNDESSNGGFKVPLPVNGTMKSDNHKHPKKDQDKKANGAEIHKNGVKKATGFKNGKSPENYIDPKTSKVYKNLFTSSEKSKKHDTAHWITYNPYHL